MDIGKHVSKAGSVEMGVVKATRKEDGTVKEILVEWLIRGKFHYTWEVPENLYLYAQQA